MTTEFFIIWTAFIVLHLGLFTAAWIDWRTRTVPKWLTLGILALGFVFNLSRGLYFGSIGRSLWALPAGPVYGAIDGLLLALTGAVLGFALFFAFWVLGIAGGGDVKLVAALGAWVGPQMGGFIVLASLLFVALFTVAQMVADTVYGKQKTGDRKPRGLRGRILTYSLPLALGSVLVLGSQLAVMTSAATTLMQAAGQASPSETRQ